MAKILVNRVSDDAAFSIDDSLILMAYTANALTHVEYLSEEDGRKRAIDVKETLAQVGGMSNLLVSTTMLDGTAVWLNGARVVSVSDIDSKAVAYFDNNGSSLRRLELNVTSIVWDKAVIDKSGDFTYTTFAFEASPNIIKLTAAQGDLTAKFTVGVVFTVFGEGNDNDAIFTVVSSAFATTTNITVTETPVVDASTNGYVWVKA